MITVTGSVTTPKGRQEVFDYLADFATVAEWDPGVLSSERTSGEGGVGTTYRVVSGFAGREVAMTYRVEEHRAPERIVLRGEGSAVTALDAIEVSERDGATRVDYRADFELRGLMRLAAPFLKGTFRRLGEKAMAGLDATLNG